MKIFRSIEGLRAWLAWWVVVGHALNLSGAGAYLPRRLAWIMVRGDLAVALFMIVSGFVIANMVLARKERYGPYITRRLFRLLPLFVVVLGLAIASRDIFATAFLDNPWTTAHAYRADRMHAEAAYGLLHLGLHLTLLHGIPPDSMIPYASTAFLAPGWSLSLEWQFYLLAPLLVAAFTRPRAGSPGLAVLLLLLSGLALHSMFGRWQLPSFLPLSIAFFWCGITSRLLLDRAASAFAIVMTGLSMALLLTVSFRSSLQSLLIVALVWVPFLAIAAREARTGRSAEWKWARIVAWLVATNPVIGTLGRWSYATYLVHVPLFGIIVGTAMRLSGRVDRPAIILFTLLAVPVILLASAALHHFVERPGIRLGAWLLARGTKSRAPWGDPASGTA